MFDEDFLENITQGMAIVESDGLLEEASKVKDARLVEVANQLMLQLQFNEETDKHIGLYFKTGSLTERGRKVLEGCYVLYYSRLTVSSDTGDVYVDMEKASS